ncbi:MAG: D-glycero-beta-D-manno-heptose 1,7-bisphosphate 7-phosphatase [Thiotrichaceae bacterium]|nr:D-glycero-beta-D-manno-heptose 1,7-bisphosphate 7-phosphatase [Thiotrichaceae bacterium]PCI12969.1 MAG: D-glycero-beta-D-manno-heptose-1,7-bisphosphate 7-phosphatase [Thiotrichales bacterium]
MKLIVLDRDGVINEDSDAFIKSPEEWRLLPGSAEAIARLTHARYQVVVVTNQSGVARGHFDLGVLNRIHEKMQREVGSAGGRIDAIFYCPHSPDDNCECRKPMPGMFQDLERRLQIKLNGIPAVGDSLRDLQAAQALGARAILVRSGKGLKTEQQLMEASLAEPVDVFDDLAAVVDSLLSNDS